MSVDVEEVFPILLGQQAPVVALAVARFYPNRLPQIDTLPAVVFRRISGGPIRISNGASPVRRALFQVESWSATSQDEARDLDRKVQAIEAIGVQVGDWWVQSLFVNPDADHDNPQLPVHADDLGLYCSFCEMTVFYQPK